MQNKERNIPPFIMLSAGIIACVMCIIRNASLLATLETVLVVLLVFYVIGLIVKSIVVKINHDAQEAALQRERERKEQAAKEFEEQQAKLEAEEQGEQTKQ